MPTPSAIDVIVDQQEDKTDPVTSRCIREVLSDAYAFIRSAEANAALATVTLDELIGDQINRNGDTDRSNAAQYNPYSFKAGKDAPEGIEPTDRANFLGAAHDRITRAAKGTRQAVSRSGMAPDPPRRESA